MTARLRGIGDPWTDNVNGDPRRRQLKRQRLGETDDAGLGCGIMGAVLGAVKGPSRGETDDSFPSAAPACAAQRI